MTHPCLNYTCLDNVHGECFAGGCSRNYGLGEVPHPMYDDDVPFAEDDNDNDDENEED